MPQHSDDEINIVNESWILTVSLGGSRNFIIEDTAGNASHNLVLQHGDVLLMSKASQTRYKHEVKRMQYSTEVNQCISEHEKIYRENRVSLTFRNMNQ